MKRQVAILFLFISISCLGQEDKSTKLNNVSLKELKMTVYDKDSTAVALVLYEHVNYYVNEQKEHNLTADYYFRIKILKKEAFDKATIRIPLFGKEKADQIKAVTYNLSGRKKITKTFLSEDKIFTKKINDKWKEVVFTLSNIKVGSVIEYTYSVTSPYLQIDDWYFQSDIPKLKSEFTASILGNWKYNISVVGFLKLNRDNPSLSENCVRVPGVGNGSCYNLEYGMDQIPAFKEERYMLSKKNYISRLSFELKSITSLDGRIQKYTKTWKDADKTLKYDFLDNQSSKKKYFRKNILNEAILSIHNSLEKTKQIFELVKRNFNWNERYWPSKKVNIKKAYENRSGNVFDINLSLFNALQAAGIESKLTLLATRDKGLPAKLYPIVNDFNYLVVRVVVDNEVYFLDATKKNMPFGMIQFSALNGEGRIMDFKKGSFWEEIQIKQHTTKNTKLVLNFEQENFSGNLIIKRTGYDAINQREELTKLIENDFLENFENRYPNIEVEDFKVRNLENLNENLQEIYKIKIEHDLAGAKNIKINPFFVDKLTVNPFKLEERMYPVDFGYPRNNTFLLSLKIPEEFIVKKLPESKAFTLPNNGGRIVFNVKESNNTINLHLKLIINKKEYSNEEYFSLKEFYNELIKIQDSFIEIQRK